ncbi:MAG: hypothetical protein ABSA33_03235 [Candidatus Micrarchaeaceae archaeon]|jgi:hypothetical protein
MQAPTSQERDRLDQMDVVIGLSDEESRTLLHVWRACGQTSTAHAPRQVTPKQQYYNGGVMVEAV